MDPVGAPTDTVQGPTGLYTGSLDDPEVPLDEMLALGEQDAWDSHMNFPCVGDPALEEEAMLVKTWSALAPHLTTEEMSELEAEHSHRVELMPPSVSKGCLNSVLPPLAGVAVTSTVVPYPDSGSSLRTISCFGGPSLAGQSAPGIPVPTEPPEEEYSLSVGTVNGNAWRTAMD